ncbi:Biofilm- and planktonic growth-induced protein [Candida albicans P76055]|nr:Biofilm- and planktonic growth-induced protein [Candida albicans P76055]
MILVCIALFWFALFLQLCNSLNCFAISYLDYCTNFFLTVNYFLMNLLKRNKTPRSLMPIIVI